jgi:hypothetical protein
MAGALAVGAVSRNPLAALATQRGLAVLPAAQAYADAYAEFKGQYPEAPDSEAQRYAASMAGVEYGIEAFVPAGGNLAGTGIRQVAGTIARRTATEAGTEGVTEAVGQGVQLGLAPELAPKTLEEAAYNVGIAAATGGIGGGAVSVPTTVIERTNLTRAQRVEQQRLAQIAAADETGKVAEGAAVVAQAEESARKGTVTESPLGPVRQEPIGPSSPFLPRAEGVDLETPRAEASTLLTPAEENIGLPRGPVSVLPGQEPSAALGLDTPRGEATPLTENPVQQARVQELTQERDALFQKGAPLTRKEKSRVKTISKELNTIATEQASFAQRASVDQLARTALPGSVEPILTTPAPTPLPTTRASRVEAARPPAQPTMEFVTEKGSRYSVQEDGTTIRDKAARKDVGHEGDSGIKPRSSKTVYADVPTSALSAAGLSGLGEKGARVVIQGDTATLLTWNEKEGRWGSSPTGRDIPISTTPKVGSYPLELWKPADDVGGLEAYRGMHAGNKIVEIKPREATAPIVREDVIDLETGRVTGEQTAEVGVPVNDTQRQELENFFNDVKANRSVNLPSDQQAAFARIMNVQVPPQQRKATPLRQALSRATTAWDALAGVKAAVRMGADPKIERYDRLIDSLATEDMKNVGFTLLQPETEPRTPFQQALKNDPKELQTKGLHEVDPATGRDEVTIVGDGYARRDGTATVETTLHEIVHAKGAAAIRAVKEGRETDAGVIQAVKDLNAVRIKLRQSIPKDGLTPDEKSAVEYATTNVDEFHANAMTNPLVQSALKKENLWDRVRSTIRALLRIPRSQKSLLDEVLDASYALTDAINKREGKAPEVRGDGEARRATTPTRSTRVADARTQFLGKGTQVEPTTDIGRRIQRFRDSVQERFFTNAVGRFIGNASRKIDVLFSANKLGTKETTEAFSKAQGAIQRAHAQMQAIGRAMDKQLGSVELQSGTGKSLLATQYLAERDATKQSEIAKKIKNGELIKTLDKARAEMDRLSTEVGRHLVEAYAGRTMPESVLDLLKTIKERMGSYLTRAYMVDIVEGDATETYNAYKRGDPVAVARIQPLVNRIGGTLAGLNSWVENARQEAKVLSDPRVQFEASDTVFGREVRQRYSDFLGNPGSKTIKEMFDELDAFAKKIPESEYAKEVDRTVQKLIGVFDDSTKNDALVQFARAMRSDDRTLRRRDRVPADLRLAWGEIINPILSFNLTAERTAAAYANLKSSNYLFDNAPNLFSEREDPQTKRLNRIPNNPTVYGKLAGMYTIPEVHDAVVAQTTTLAPGGAGNDITGMVGNAVAGALRKAQPVLGFNKLTQIAMNGFNSVLLNSTNLLYMPLANGNTNITTLPRAMKAIQASVFTAYRSKNINEDFIELLDQGVIDPVQLQTDEEVRNRTRAARAFERGQVVQGTVRDAVRKGITDPVNSLREVVNFLELVPKAWNYFSAKEELRAIYPDLSEQQLRDMAAEQTNRLNPTYTRTRNIVRGMEVTQMSYTANYMEQIASNGARSINLGIVQTKNGLKTGNPRLAIAGLKKLLGNVTALGLSYGLPATVLGILGISPEEEDETIADNLPFNERGMQPVILGVNGDRVVYTDAGRVNPGDTLHAPMRAIISAIANVSSGNMDEAERDFNGAMTNLQGQFAGGAPLGQMMLRLFTDKRTGRQLEEDAPEFYSLVADKAGVFAADATNVAYAGGFPAQFKGILRSDVRQDKQGDEFEWNLIETLMAVRAPVREVSLGESVKFEALNYRNARRDPSDDLKRIMLLPSEERAGEDRLREEVVRLIEAQQKPYEEMMRSVTALRAVGQRQGMSAKDTETMIRGALKDATLAKDEIDQVVAGAPFRPRPLSQQFAVNDIKNRVNREGVRQEKVRLETLFNQRLETVRRLMDEEIAKFD